MKCAVDLHIHSCLSPCGDEGMTPNNICNMARLKELEKEFPQLDCGACGAPTCHAFAEDVVRGYGKKEGCIFLQKKQETGEKDR